ncbi:MAG TPA: DoxX family protein [Candidatus Binatia bacterium]|nr:DoxX family protein [Candidatus Binatia bacterium]
MMPTTRTLLVLLYDLPSAAGRSAAWLPPLLARLACGWVFASTGWGKLADIERVVEFFESLGIPFAHLQAPMVASLELVCGLLVMAGLATRMAVLPLIGTMVVAIATAQWESVSSAAALFGLVETLYIVVFVWLLAAGPGAISLDAVLEEKLRRLAPRSAANAARVLASSTRS